MKPKLILKMTSLVAMIVAQSSCNGTLPGRVDFHTNVKGVPVSLSVGK